MDGLRLTQLKLVVEHASHALGIVQGLVDELCTVAAKPIRQKVYYARGRVPPRAQRKVKTRLFPRSRR